MKKLLMLSLGVFALGVVNIALAAGGSTVSVSSSDAKMVSPERIPPYQQNPVNYIFDQTGVKTLINGKSTLLQVNCNSTAILQALGLGATTKKIFSIGLEENGYEYTFDIRNCSLRGNKVNNIYNYTKSLTEKEAFALADAFMKTSYLKDKIFSQFGQPFVVYKNSNGPVYPVMKEGMAYRETDTDFSDIEIDPNDTGDVMPEYTSFSIMYPYIINGQEVREQYGNRAGLTLEVSADGVMSFNARLLPFKGAKRNSEELSGDDAVRILKNGGNSPFRGSAEEIQFAKPIRVLVLFNLRRDNKNYLYLSSGIGLKSDVRVDQWTQQPYTMILSDYKIGNTAQ